MGYLIGLFISGLCKRFFAYVIRRQLQRTRQEQPAALTALGFLALELL